MSTQAYVTGETVRMQVLITSTATTKPEDAIVHLVVTSPAGADTVYAKAALQQATSTKDSTALGAITFYRDFVPTEPGRWTYEFISTGLIVSKAGGAFAVARPMASTST